MARVPKHLLAELDGTAAEQPEPQVAPEQPARRRVARRTTVALRDQLVRLEPGDLVDAVDAKLLAAQGVAFEPEG